MTVTLAFIGDVMLGRLVSREIERKQPPESFWGDTLSVLKRADAVFANLECAVTPCKQKWNRTRKVFHFGAAPEAIEVLKAGNVRYVSLANNHILDFQEQGLFDTLKYLEQAGIHSAGAGRNLEEAMRPALINIPMGPGQSLKIAALSLTDNEPPFAAGLQKPGTWYCEVRPGAETPAPIQERVRKAREDGAELIVLSAHTGPNMEEEPPPHFRAFSETLADGGVDIFHGHSAHIFQAAAVRKSRLILYDTGDFLDDYAVDPVLHSDWSFIFLVEADKAGLLCLRMLPVKLEFASVHMAAGEEFDAIRERMKKLCSRLGTPVKEIPQGLELLIRQ